CRFPDAVMAMIPLDSARNQRTFPNTKAFELIHARWAMFGAAGFIIPVAFNKYGANCGPEAVWFKVGTMPSNTRELLLDGNTLNYLGNNIPINLIVAVITEVILVGGAECYRITNSLDFEDKLHPGGPFDPLGLANDPDQAVLLKVKEIKNGKACNVCDARFLHPSLCHRRRTRREPH
ncbi:Chlorophyll a-b binding protein CP26, chloroplastic-like protein, partial [Drosera capensis]